MIDKVKNTGELKSFVEEMKLRDSHSNILFSAEIKIKTNRKSLFVTKKVLITFDGYNNYGKVSIIDKDSEIDSNDFPEIFDAQFQDFSFINESYLEITGNHTRNPNIGNYTVKITPIDI